jgi:hypothetical protein
MRTASTSSGVASVCWSSSTCALLPFVLFSLLPFFSYTFYRLLESGEGTACSPRLPVYICFVLHPLLNALYFQCSSGTSRRTERNQMKLFPPESTCFISLLLVPSFAYVSFEWCHWLLWLNLSKACPPCLHDVVFPRCCKRLGFLHRQPLGEVYLSSLGISNRYL